MVVSAVGGAFETTRRMSRQMKVVYAVGGALSDTAIRPSVCPTTWAIGTLAACSLAMCELRTRPQTDADPPRVELPTAGGISSRPHRGDNLF